MLRLEIKKQNINFPLPLKTALQAKIGTYTGSKQTNNS